MVVYGTIESTGAELMLQRVSSLLAMAALVVHHVACRQDQICSCWRVWP